MKVGIYDTYLKTLGGGENFLAVFAEVIEECLPSARIHLLTHEQRGASVDEIADRFGVRLERTALRVIPATAVADRGPRRLLRRYLHEQRVSRVSAEYDLFVNNTVFSVAPPRALASIYMCMFPADPASHVRRAEEWLPAKLLASARTILKRRLYRQWLGRYTALLANSEFTRSWIRRRWNLDSIVLYPPVETNASMRTAWKSGTRILAIGRFFPGSHNKRHDVLIETFRQLLEHGAPDADLHLVGGRSEIAGTQEYIRRLRDLAVGLPVRFHFDATRRELQQLLRTSSIFWHATGHGVEHGLAPERLEHFGIATVEAMSHGCVPVVYRCGGQSEIVEHGRNGFLWRHRDSLLAYTLELLSDSRRTRELSLAAHRRSVLFGREVFRKTAREILGRVAGTAGLRLPRALAMLLVLLLVTSISACRRGESDGAGTPPSRVVVIGIDTLRRDFLGSYGFPGAISPNIDALAREGALFTKAVSTAPWTLPAFASMLTGELPSFHGAGRRTGAQRPGGEPPKAGMPSFPIMLQERLSRAGWLTATFYDNPYLGGAWGLTRGFQEVRRARHGGAGSVAAALSWLEEHEQSQVFVFLHLMEPHAPYTPPPAYAAEARRWFPEGSSSSDGSVQLTPTLRNRLSSYAGEVAYVDALVGSFVDGLRRAGWLDDTLLILTADHGEEFFEHATNERLHYEDPRELWGVGHGHSLYQELIAIPLIVRFPGHVRARTRVPALVQIHDIAPSILDWVGVSAVPRMAGRSLRPVLDRTSEPDPAAISEFILYGGARAAIRRGHWKAITDPADTYVELYDLRADPGEAHNLSEAFPGRARRLVMRLHREQAESRARAEELSSDADGERGPVEIDEDTRRELRALGYIQR